MASKYSSSHTAGNISLFLYCAIFGTAFFVASNIHLASLRGFQKENKCSNDDSPLAAIIDKDQLILNTSSASSSPSLTQGKGQLSTCQDLKGWTCLATTGLVYSIMCLLFGFLKLLPAMWKGCWDTSYCRGDQEGEENEARGKIFRPVGTTHVSHDWWKGRHQTNFGFWSACFQCIHFVLMHIFWLAALIVPTTLAVGLCSSNGIHGHDSKFYWPALSLFIISIFSLVFVSISAFSMVFCKRSQVVGMTPAACHGHGGHVCEAGGGRYEPVELKDSICKKTPAASA